jgi:hypothetical protein
MAKRPKGKTKAWRKTGDRRASGRIRAMRRR